MANGLKISSSWVSVNRKAKRIALQFSQTNVIRKINIIKSYPITATGMPNYRTQSVSEGNGDIWALVSAEIEN